MKTEHTPQAPRLTTLEAELLAALEAVLPLAARFVEKAGPEQVAQVEQAQALAARARAPVELSPAQRAALVEIADAERRP